MKYAILILAGALALSTAITAQTQTDKSKDSTANQAQPAKPAGGTKTAPQTKSKEETEAMQAVLAKSSDPAAMQAAADDFATKFPDSTVRGMLYRQVMLVYQQQGNESKGYEAGRKALTYDADDPLTLSFCAVYLASHTQANDLDKDERLADSRKMANDAITNIAQLRLNDKVTDEQREQYKQFILSQAYAALAIGAQVNKDWATAEANYEKSMQAAPDAATLAREAFAQKMQGKLEPALANFNKAIELGNQQQAAGVVQFATSQRDALQKQIDKQKATPAAPAPAAPKQ